MTKLMTIQEALKAAQEIFPDDDSVHVSLECTLGVTGRLHMTRWLHCNRLDHGVVSSDKSWEHALAQAKAENTNAWPAVDDEQVSAC